ncbi:MAG: hypothetical protein ACFE7R_06375, partial [Candidatus Hodarchaeota archaeon]
MVYYTDVPDINKRMVAGYYLFLCLIGFAVLLGPSGGGIPIALIGNPTADQHQTAEPGWGDDPTDCIMCHDFEYGNWSMTNHADHVYYNGSHYRIGAYVWVTNTTF